MTAAQHQDRELFADIAARASIEGPTEEAAGLQDMLQTEVQRLPLQELCHVAAGKDTGASAFLFRALAQAEVARRLHLGASILDPDGDL